MKHLATTCRLLCAVVLLASCSKKEPATQKSQEKTQTEAPAAGATATATYTCLMDPDVKTNAPGKCPKCGMDLVLMKADSTSAAPQAR